MIDDVRSHPSGAPARLLRRPGGVGRSTSVAAERVSDDLRRGRGEFLTHRRWVAALSSLATAAFTVVGLYQFGVLRRVPEPRLRSLDADRVDAAGEAYQLFKTPDAGLALASAAGTLILAGMGDRHRSQHRPWVPIALAAKAGADAAAGLFLFAEQFSKHRRVCSWCTLAAAAQIATLPIAIPEARAAWRAVRGATRHVRR
jgi:hypothetical protein